MLLIKYEEKLDALSNAYNVFYQIHSDPTAEIYIDDILDKKIK